MGRANVAGHIGAHLTVLAETRVVLGTLVVKELATIGRAALLGKFAALRALSGAHTADVVARGALLTPELTHLACWINNANTVGMVHAFARASAIDLCPGHLTNLSYFNRISYYLPC